jgi:pyruvate/2-oxoglutarate dehydrogenase complex dihydrolipoamide acyltransferase (E2) component
MIVKKSMLAAACAGLAVLGSISLLRADQWDKKTVVTVSEPIIAGNKVLQPGTYVWKLMESSSSRHIVQIFNQDQSKLETTMLAIPNYRLQPTGNTQFAYWETPAGVPKAVRAWFYPGDNFGQEFAFPKKLVAQLASAQPVPVPTSYNPPAEPEPAAAPAPAPEPEPQPTAAAPEPAPAPVAEPASQQAAAPVEQPASLPKTASYAPFVGLVGLFSLGFFSVLSLATVKKG